MVNTVHTQLSQNSVNRRLQQPERANDPAGCMQDNPAPPRARAASPQPGSPKKDTRSRQLQTNNPRSQKLTSRKTKAVQVVMWVKPVVKAELQRLAETQGLSMSSTGAAFLEKALQQNLHSQHTMLLDTVIEKAIGKHMKAYSNRLAVLLVRSLVTTDVVLSLVTNILGRHPGMTQKDLANILTASDTKARANITRITPQLKTFIEAVQKEFMEEVKQNG